MYRIVYRYDGRRIRFMYGLRNRLCERKHSALCFLYNGMHVLREIRISELMSSLWQRLRYAAEKSLYAYLSSEQERYKGIKLLIVSGEDINEQVHDDTREFIVGLPWDHVGYAYRWMVVHYHENTNSVELSNASFHIVFNLEKKKCELKRIHLGRTGYGAGRTFFLSLVERCTLRGIETITLSAADHDGQNGYYTWAVFGFAMQSTQEQEQAFNNLLRRQVTEDVDFGCVHTLQDLISLGEKGRQLRKKEGFAFEGVFDCRPGSRSRELFFGSVSSVVQK